MITICTLQNFLLLYGNNIKKKRNRKLTFFSDSSSGWLGMSSFFTLEKLDNKREIQQVNIADWFLNATLPWKIYIGCLFKRSLEKKNNFLKKPFASYPL